VIADSSIMIAALVPFEIVACNVIIHYWSDIVPPAGIIVIVIVLYGYVSGAPFLRQSISDTQEDASTFSL
jgi:hypothetical protein